MIVQISARTIAFPPLCACCCAPAQTNWTIVATRTTGVRVVRHHSQSWAFPYCTGCAAHASAWPAPIGCATVFLSVLTCGAYFIVDSVLRGKAEARSRSMCGPSCVVPWSAVRYVGWSGSVHSFDVASRDFAIALMRANRSRLVNVDWNVAALLDQASAPAARPPAQLLPTGNGGTDSDHAAFQRAVQQIERAGGPASRRAARDAGLAAIGPQHLRERLHVEAARIETAAVLEKVETLKTPAARRRHLLAALEHLRNDPVPDELQAKEIALLETELQALDGTRR
jgi:hypothetical protein